MSKEEISMEEQPLCSHIITEIPVKFEPRIQEKYEYSEEEIKKLEQDNIELRKYYATRKEVEDLKDTINCLHESSKEYINKDKIRDKIKELEKQLQEYEESDIEEDEDYLFDTNAIRSKIEVLKSMIGE